MPADYPKITCSAFGCKRYTRTFPPGSEMLCRTHYMMAPASLRKLFKKNNRSLKKFGRQRELAREARLWQKIVDCANRNIGMPE